jgi:hypothetical protein
MAGGLFSLCVRRGGVGTVVGRSFEAAFIRATEGSREDTIEEECSDAVSAELDPMMGGLEGVCNIGCSWCV